MNSALQSRRACVRSCVADMRIEVIKDHAGEKPSLSTYSPLGYHE